MDDHRTLDLSLLVGFDQIGQSRPEGEVDFRDDALGAKIGAKRGDVEAVSPASEKP